jgi:prephenate dehydrogenase
VIAEMCSLKGHLRPTLERMRAQGLRVVSFHPMFGPGATMLSGKKILFCREGREEDVALVRGLFETTSADLVSVGAEEHDRLMALVLGLAHLSNIAVARALQRSGTPFARLEEAAGVTFRKQIATTSEVVRENPRLYYEIQRLNGATDAVAALLVEAVEEARDAVRRGDHEAFESLMLAARRYFESP